MIGLSTINRKKIVFICSPYSGKTEAEQIRNVELARKYCSIACSLGFTPFAPHLLYPQFLDNSIREERDTGINCGLDILQYAMKSYYLKLDQRLYTITARRLKVEECLTQEKDLRSIFEKHIESMGLILIFCLGILKSFTTT